MTDRTEMYVDAKEGAAIRAALTKSETGFITVRGTTIKKTAILKLEEGGVDPHKPVSIFDDPKALLAEGCRGEGSIHKELMRIASKQKNFKLLADPKWRAEQTAIIKESGMELCDPAAGKCICKPADARVATSTG